LAVERRPSYTGFGEQTPSFGAIGRALLQSGLTGLWWCFFEPKQRYLAIEDKMIESAWRLTVKTPAPTCDVNARGDRFGMIFLGNAPFSRQRAASRDQRTRGNEQPGFSAIFILRLI
jgi:hypothetical protein